MTLNKQEENLSLNIRVTFINLCCYQNKTRGLKLPPGCKTSPCNSTISIEPDFATFNEIILVESIKSNLKWPKNGPEMDQM